MVTVLLKLTMNFIAWSLNVPVKCGPIDFIEEQMVHFDRFRALAAKTGQATSTIPDHEDILYALKRKDVEMAEMLMARHLTRYQTEKNEIMKQYPEYFTN